MLAPGDRQSSVWPSSIAGPSHPAVTVAGMRVLVLSALTVAASASEWRCALGEQGEVPAGTCATAAWTCADGGAARSFTSATLILARGARALIVEQPVSDKAAAPKVAAVMAAAGAVAAINGGYFTAEFAPAGLLRIDGRELAPLSREPAQSGVAVIDSRGALALRRRDDALDDAVAAVQAGPFIIDPGGQVGIRPAEHPPMARRSLIIVARDGSVALAATSEVALRDLADCLHDHPVGFGLGMIERALDLDGGPSTALSIAGWREPSPFVEKAPVRDVLVVLPPAKP
jgi:hypothetical protein